MTNKILDDDLLDELKTTAKREEQNTTPISKKDPGNIQDGTNTPEGFLNGINFEPEMNPMSALFSPSYHFSFYLDGELPSERGKAKFIIAETGLTGMNIQEVNIDSVVGPNIRSKNAMTTNITIRIFEPFGAMLPDLLYQAAVTKGIRNYLKAPWFLDLRLHGYDSTGKVVNVGDKWTWQISLIDVASQISENGAMHTITAMPVAEQAFNDQYCILANGTKASGTTVGEALKAVIDGMNTSVKSRYGDSKQPLIQFAVESRDYPYDTKVGVKNPFDHPITRSLPTTGKQTNNDGYEGQTGHFSSGTDFPSIVEQVMARSETALKIVRNSRELPPASGDDLENEVKDVTSIFHRIDTKVEYLDYDYVAGDYIKKITYIIKPYTSLRILTSMGRAQKFDKSPKLNKEKAEFAVQQAFLKKQYNYIFTGDNTEIEKFDINVNFNWAIQVPVFQAQNTNTGTPAQIDLAKSVVGLQGDLDNKNSALSAKQTELEDFDRAHPSDPNNPPNETDTQHRQQLESELNTLKTEVNQLSTVVGKKRDEYNTLRNKEREQMLSRRPLPTSDITNGEDLVYANAQGSNDFHGASQNSASYLPITILQDAGLASRTDIGTAKDNDPNKTVYGALLNQLYGATDSNLQNLDLEIRGDPYWLGPGSTGEPFDAPSSKDMPNFANGEHIFVFRFKLPLGYDASTGTVSVSKESNGSAGMGDQASTDRLGTDSNIFTGFFACIQVESKFYEGKFTQMLRATRIPGWVYENIIEGRESAVNDETVFNRNPGPSTPSVSSGSAGSAGGYVSGSGLSERELLAVTLLGEAGGEGATGMQAVGNVIMNRARTGYMGNTPSQVIMKDNQFSVWNNQSPSAYLSRVQGTAAYNKAYDMAGQLLSGNLSDVTGGANQYLNLATVTRSNPNGSWRSWYDASKVTKKIGNHTFLRL